MSANAKVESFYKSLEEREAAVLEDLKNRGFQSPFKEFSESLISGDNRRYLKELIEIDYCQIEENQVAKNLIDRNRCENVLKPWIEKDGLQNPSLVEEPSIGNTYPQITGHNRAYTEDMIRGKVTVIVCTKNYNTKGDQVPSDILVLQGARSNPAAKHRSYSMADAAITLADSLKQNPTQEGKNPSGMLPPRNSQSEFDFDDFIDRVYNTDRFGKPVLHPHFPHPATRTKIRNLMIKNSNSSKVVDMTAAVAQTNHLNRIGWNDGLNSKGKRKSAYQHFDTDRNAIIVMADDSGTNVDRAFWQLAKKWHPDNSKFKQIVQENKIKYIDICARIYNPDADKASLDTARNKFKETIEESAKILWRCGVRLKVRYIAFPKQLLTSQDKDTIVKL